MSHRPRKSPVQGRAIATWTAILDAATQLFEASGYDEVTTNAIAARAGVSIGSLYQYFPNKSAIVTAIAERHLGDALTVLEAVDAMAERQGLGLAPTLRAMIEASVTAHAAHPAVHRFLFLAAPRTPESLRLLGAVEDRVADMLTARLAAAGVAGPNAHLRARLAVQGMEAQIHTVLLDPRGRAASAIMDEMVAMWTAALERPDPPA